MKKRLPVVLVATLILAAMLGATAHAASAQDIVNSANASIAQEISQATAQANQATFIYQTSVSIGGNAQLLALYRAIYDARLDQIGSSLVSKTDRIAKKAIADCAALGVIVVCEYTPVTLGDQVVYVDPLVVVGQ